MNGAVERTTGKAPSAAPVGTPALQARPAPPPDPEERDARRRFAFRASAVLIAAGVVAFGVALAVVAPRGQAAARRGVAVLVDVPVRADMRAARAAAILQAAARAPDRLPLLLLEPRTVDEITTGDRPLEAERLTNDGGVRRFEANVDVDAVAARLCARVAANHDATLQVALADGGGAPDAGDRLARALADACIRASAVTATPREGEIGAGERRVPGNPLRRSTQARWLVEGTVARDASGELRGALRLREVVPDRAVDVVSARTGVGDAAAIVAWRDAFVHAIAASWRPRPFTITIKGLHGDDDAGVGDALRGLAVLSEVRPLPGRDGAAAFDVVSFADHETLADAIDGVHAGAGAIVVLEVWDGNIVGRLR